LQLKYFIITLINWSHAAPRKQLTDLVAITLLSKNVQDCKDFWGRF